MKFGIFSLLFLLAFNSYAQEEKVLKYSCLMNKSESLKVFSEYKEGQQQVSVVVDHFLFGERELVKLSHPAVVDYGNVFMAMQNYGRSGYFFIRFEDGKKASEHDIGDALGMIDDSRFNVSDGLGYSPGALSVIANCKKEN